MNKNAIIEFVDFARESLEAAVRLRAAEYGVSEKGAEEHVQVINGKVLSNIELAQRDALILAIKQASESKGFAHGYEQVMEEAAYTWFNRFIALRFMEVNGYLPSHTRIFSNNEGQFNPQILAEALTVSIEGKDVMKVSEMIQNNQKEELFKYFIILQCNELSGPIPEMFERISDYTELLFPNGLLKNDSVIGKMVMGIPEDDWKEQVQIIGWMYQFYISKKKDAVFASKKTITKDTIAAVTQLFTPDWIVRYMVENSIGRIWLESYPDSPLKKEFKYYVDDAEQPESVKTKLEAIRYKDVDPISIKVIEPCCGSGHILVYCFDILYRLYIERGYAKKDVPSLILKHNLTGLDIDRRASQLAAFSLIMKARSYDSLFFKKGVLPQVYEIEDTSSISLVGAKQAMERRGFSSGALSVATYLVETFKDAKVIGSLLKVLPKNYSQFIEEAEEKVKTNKVFDLTEQDFDGTMRKLIYVAKLAEILSKRYDVMITNPPYISSDKFDSEQKKFFGKYYPNSRADMYAMFMETSFVRKNGFLSMVNMHGWMFISSFEKLRKALLMSKDVLCMAHLGPRAFEAINGEIVQTTTFVMRNALHNQYGVYHRLVNYEKHNEKQSAFEAREAQCFVRSNETFLQLPGYIYDYWLSEPMKALFLHGEPISSFVETKDGLTTGENDKFIRYFWEVNYPDIGRGFDSERAFRLAKKRYAPILKGGNYRKWYGNNWFVIKFDEKNADILAHCGNKLPSRESYFQPYITWNRISTGMSFRYVEAGYLFESASLVAMAKQNESLFGTLGFANSSLAYEEMRLINPTTNMLTGYVNQLRVPKGIAFEESATIASRCIEIMKEDWDTSETSWDFRKNALIPTGSESSGKGVLIRDQYCLLAQSIANHFQELLNLETCLNSLFAVDGLSNELFVEPSAESISLHKADASFETKTLLSYFVGLIMGRYSLYSDGLVYAGGPWDPSKYKVYQPDEDGITVINNEFFGDDSLDTRCIELIRQIYGADTFEANISFVAEALGGKGSPREVIQNYFLNGFYADHLKVYQKRPIYWLLDAGKKNSFKALIYLHRYTPDTLATVRTDYVLPLLDRYDSQIEVLAKDLASAESHGMSGGEVAKTRKKLDLLREQRQELAEYEQKIHHLADQRIELDLDDGVKVNYAKLADVLAPIK